MIKRSANACDPSRGTHYFGDDDVCGCRALERDATGTRPHVPPVDLVAVLGRPTAHAVAAMVVAVWLSQKSQHAPATVTSKLGGAWTVEMPIVRQTCTGYRVVVVSVPVDCRGAIFYAYNYGRDASGVSWTLGEYEEAAAAETCFRERDRERATGAKSNT